MSLKGLCSRKFSITLVPQKQLKTRDDIVSGSAVADARKGKGIGCFWNLTSL